MEFFIADAADAGTEGYDLACIFDAWHDMGDPVGVAKAIREKLTDDGTFLVVELMALDGLQNNIENNPAPECSTDLVLWFASPPQKHSRLVWD